jgi:hypothetical protein
MSRKKKKTVDATTVLKTCTGREVGGGTSWEIAREI